MSHPKHHDHDHDHDHKPIESQQEPAGEERFLEQA